MKQKRSFFQAEKLKYRHTPVNAIIIFMPLLTAFLSAWLMGSYFTVDAYNWWYIGIYPGGLGILCSIIGRKDKAKKNYTIWSLPCKMEKIWDAKIAVGAVFSGISVFVLTVLIVLGENLIEHILKQQMRTSMSFGTQLLAGFVLWLTTLWMVPFCLFLSQKIGTFLMLIIHMGIYTVLSASVSLKPYFFLFPGAITARVMCPLIKVLPNGLLFEPGQLTYSPELGEISGLWIGVFSAIVWFFICWLYSRKWFQKQTASAKERKAG